MFPVTGFAADDHVVLLPPIEVTAKLQTTPWRYANVDGVEILSSCSELTTRLFIQREHRLVQLLASVVPAELQVKLSVPKIVILSDQKRTLSASQELVAGLGREPTPAPAAKIPGALRRPGAAVVRFMPNLRLNDFDSVATFAMVDEGRFNPDHLGLSPEYTRFVLEHRTPPLPAWTIEGFTGVVGRMQFGNLAMLIPTAEWRSGEETNKLKKDPDFPRGLLPMRELLEKGPAAFANSPEDLRHWRAQAALMVRWVLDGDEARVSAFRKYVSRAAAEPATEALFQECFGMNYADARDHLSDYLPVAIREPFRIQPAKLPPVPSFRLRIATDAEVSRIKGEWERLVVVQVRANLPQYAARYEELAARTLDKSLAPAARDPRFLAVLGLHASDAGRDEEARPFLEAAVAAKVVRPRAYFELARLRYIAAIAQPAGANGRLNAAQANGVLEPLRIARAQQPPLPQTYALTAEVWRNSEVRLAAQHFELLDEGLRLFPAQPTLLYQIAALKVQQGTGDAARLIERGLRLSPTPAGREAFEKLRAGL